MNILLSIATKKSSVFVEKIRRIRTPKERGLHLDVYWRFGAEFPEILRLIRNDSWALTFPTPIP